jgi:4-amino-4-deoxy-L-arabinose transferase-like glycosyltransferase
MTRKTATIVAAAIACIHLILACVYANITPYRTDGILMGQRNPETGAFQSVPDIGAPDERQHANYAMRLARGQGFPILDPKDPALIENYQAHQPPLYYLIEAGWTKLFGIDLESKDVGLLARLPNAFIGMITVLGTYFLGLWAFQRSDVGLIAASFVALLPMNAALSGAISNDPLLYCLCTWTLAYLARGCVEGWDFKVACTVGMLTGLAILTKTTAVALLPILLLSIFIGPNKPSIKHVAICSILLIGIAAPWLMRNQNLYGDPLAISAFNKAFENSPSRELITQIAEVQNPGKDPNFAYWVDWVGWWTARSFFGVFGYMDIFLNERGISVTNPKAPNSLYRALLALGFLTFVLWVFALRQTEWAVHKKMHWLLGAFLTIIVVLFLRFNMQYFQAQARYLFPAISVLGTGVGIAVLAVARQRWQAGLAVVVGILAALNLYILARIPGEFRDRANIASLAFQTDLTASNVLSGNDAIFVRV